MNKIAIVLSSILLCTFLYAQKSFRILSRGMVRDNETNLIWARCPISDNNKPIYDFNCNGDKKLFSWSEAVDVCENLDHEGRSDWRLPNVRELQTIVEYQHYPNNEKCSQSNESVFPNVIEVSECTDFWAESKFWTSTLAKNNDTCGNIPAWYVDFKFGNTGWSPQSNYQGPPSSGGNPWINDTPAECVIVSPAKKYVRCVAGP